MLLQPCRYGIGSAVGDYSIHQTITTRFGDFFITEPETFPAVEVIRQVEVNLERLAADLTRLFRVGGQHDLVLGGDERVGAEQFASVRGVFGCRQVRVRTCAAPRRQLEHLRTERRDHPAAFRHAVLVELVEVLGERIVGLAVLVSRLGMPDADAQQEAARIGLVDAVEGLGDGSGLRGPDVDDARGDLQRGGLLEDRFDPIQLGRRRSADPHGAIAQRLDVLRMFGCYSASERSEPAEVGLLRSISHGSVNPPKPESYSAAAGSSVGVAASGAGATSGSRTMNLVCPGSECTR